MIRGLGLSQAEAAIKMGISRQTLNAYFNRAELPGDVANTELLCEVLAALTKVPIEEVRAKANRLTHEKMRLVEQVLDRLIEVPSGGENKTRKTN